MKKPADMPNQEDLRQIITVANKLDVLTAALGESSRSVNGLHESVHKLSLAEQALRLQLQNMQESWHEHTRAFEAMTKSVSQLSNKVDDIDKVEERLSLAEKSVNNLSLWRSYIIGGGSVILLIFSVAGAFLNKTLRNNIKLTIQEELEGRIHIISQDVVASLDEKYNIDISN